MDAAVDEFWFAHDVQVRLEVTDQKPISHNIRISVSILLIKHLQTPVSYTETKIPGFRERYILESTVKMRSHDEIGNCQSLANKVRLMSKDAVKILQDPLDLNLGSFNGLFIVVLPSEGGTEPVAETGKDFMVCEGAPLHGLGVGFGVGGDQGCVGVLLGDCRGLVTVMKEVQFEQLDERLGAKSDWSLRNVVV